MSDKVDEVAESFNKDFPFTQSEEEIIGGGLALVRDGILNGDWHLVCKGYNQISGETLEPFIPKVKPKTKLELIRDAIVANTVDDVVTNALAKPEKDEPPDEKATIKYKKPKKKELVKPEDLKEDLNFAVKTTEKLKGGNRFAMDGFTVIQTEVDEDELARNEEVQKKTLNMEPILRPEPIKDSSKDPNPERSVRVYLNPPPPKWASREE